MLILVSLVENNFDHFKFGNVAFARRDMKNFKIIHEFTTKIENYTIHINSSLIYNELITFTT